MSDLTDGRLMRLYEMPLLVSDSQREFNLLQAAVQQRLAPRDFLEHLWASELSCCEWEMLQLRRFKKEIITSARVPALQNLLGVIYEGSHHNATEDLAHRYFTNKEMRRKIEKLLRRYGLSENSIDAEAFRRSLDDLTRINQRLAELASRRDKIWQRLEDYRAGLAQPCAALDPADRQQEC